MKLRKLILITTLTATLIQSAGLPVFAQVASESAVKTEAEEASKSAMFSPTPTPIQSQDFGGVNPFIDEGEIPSASKVTNSTVTDLPFTQEANPSADIRQLTRFKNLSKKLYKSGESVDLTVENSTANQISVKVVDPKGNIIPANIKKTTSGLATILHFAPAHAFRPGKYTVKVKDETGREVSQDFTWGVLAINSNKSIYQPGETADLSLGVLNETGDMVCDAKVTVTITSQSGQAAILSTDNGQIVINPECQTHEITQKSDYEAHFQTTSSGHYSIAVKAVTSNGTYDITDGFDVAENAPFDVERTSATRIYPANTYPMNMKFKANRDFQGIVTEEVPASFDVFSSSTQFDSVKTVDPAFVDDKGNMVPVSLRLPYNGPHDITLNFGEHLLDPQEKDLYARFGLTGHDGVDFALAEGTPVISADNGTVTLAGPGAYGTTVVIHHLWGNSYYGHLSKVDVKVGDTVGKGQQVGLSGHTGLATGPHLHFSIKPNQFNPQNGFYGKVDPMQYLAGGPVNALAVSSTKDVLGISSSIISDGVKRISWKVDVKKGEEVNLSYNYRAPYVSPEFYLLGPLTFSEDNKKVFSETRQWQIASDAIIVSSGISADDPVRYGGNQRKIAFLNNAWYSFKSDATPNVVYSKSTDQGDTWSSPTILDTGCTGCNTDANDVNPSIAMYGNKIYAAWVDTGTNKIEVNTIDTANSDAKGTQCTSTSPGTLSSTMQLGISIADDGTVYLAINDPGASSTVAKIYKLTFSGCTFTDISGLASNSTIALNDTATYSTPASTNAPSVAHTVNSGTNYLLAKIGFKAGTVNSATWTVSSGQAMSLVTSCSTTNVAIYALANPTTGAGTLSVSMSGANPVIVEATGYSNVNTSTGMDNCAANATGGATFTTSVDDVVSDVTWQNKASVPTKGASQTLEGSGASGGSGSTAQGIGGSYQTATTTSTTMSWTYTGGATDTWTGGILHPTTTTTNILTAQKPISITTVGTALHVLNQTGSTLQHFVYNGSSWSSTAGVTVASASDTNFSIVPGNSSSKKMWVAGGSGTNSLAYSNDGITWTGLGTSIFSTNGYGVAWNGSKWVAVGYGTNSLAYSSDGITWTGLGTSVITSYGQGIGWGGSKWVAVGVSGNTIAYSLDGVTWTGLGTSIFSSSGNGAAWNGSKWVAAGSGTNTLAYSLDGITWTGLGTSIFSSFGYGVAWNGSMWVATGQGTNTLAYSLDGITWTGLGTSIFGTGYRVAWNGSKWVATGNSTNTLAYSLNGTTWTGLGNTVFTTSGKGIAWNGSKWVATGSGTNTLAYSLDGITWTGLGATTFTSQSDGLASNNAPNLYPAVAPTTTHPASYWVATGQGTNSLAYSKDGLTWTGLGTSIFSTNGNSVAWNGSKWVAVGNGTNTISYSSDGITWTGLGTGVLTTIGWGVAANEKMWVAVGALTNTIAYSLDGITWTGLGTGIFQNGAYSIGWNGSKWVAGGTGTNTLAYSLDGIVWTGLGTSIFATNSQGVAWNGSMWVATGLGASNTLAYSYDGVTWTGLGISIFSSVSSDIAWNGSKWVATGGGTNTLAYSLDGITWTGLGTSIFSTNGNDIAWDGSKWLAVGEGTNSFAYSLDGITWTGLGTAILSTKGTGIASNYMPQMTPAVTPYDPNDYWVSAGQGTNSLAYSKDGITWTGLGTGVFSTGGNGVAWNGSKWVAAGAGTNSLAYSLDGVTWTGLGTGVFSTGGNGVAWNGSKWVAAGAGTNTLAYSLDGITWTGLGTGVFSSNGYGVAWNGSKWVAVGSTTRTVAYSLDGIIWTAVANSFTLGGTGAAWNGNQWVAGGTGTTTLQYSVDGIIWTRLGSSIFSANGVGLAWNGYKMVAVGSGTNSIAYSLDGITWTGLGTGVFSTGGNGVASTKAPFLVPSQDPSTLNNSLWVLSSGSTGSTMYNCTFCATGPRGRISAVWGSSTPFSGKTNYTGSSISYDSINSRLYAFGIHDASSQAYYTYSDPWSPSWSTEQTLCVTPGTVTNISSNATSTPTSSTDNPASLQIGAVMRVGTQYQFRGVNTSARRSQLMRGGKWMSDCGSSQNPFTF